jgi:hypothetical protein
MATVALEQAAERKRRGGAGEKQIADVDAWLRRSSKLIQKSRRDVERSRDSVRGGAQERDPSRPFRIDARTVDLGELVDRCEEPTVSADVIHLPARIVGEF